MVVSVDKYTTVKMYDKVQHYWAIEKQKIMQERNAAATKEQRDELTRILNYMNRVEMAVIVSEEADEVEKFQKQGLDIAAAPAENECCNAQMDWILRTASKIPTILYSLCLSVPCG